MKFKPAPLFSALAILGAFPCAPALATNGVVYTLPAGSKDNFSYCGFLGANNKVVLAGKTNTSGDDFLAVRYLLTGALDATFGSGGIVKADIGKKFNDTAHACAEQADGKIVLAGYATAKGGMGNFAVARLNTNGTLDSSFNKAGSTGGSKIVDFGGNDIGWGVAIQADGKIVAGGYSNVGGLQHYALTRLNTNGSTDTTFGSSGKAEVSIGSFFDLGQRVVMHQNKILAIGQTFNGNDTDYSMIRLELNGSLDTSFGSAGSVVTSISQATQVAADDLGEAVAIDATDRILMGGSVAVGGALDFGAARYNANGSLDTSFGTNGTVTVALEGDDRVHAVASDSQGRVLLAGHTMSTRKSMAVVRLNGDGSLDATFGVGGKVVLPFLSDSHVHSIMEQADGKILLGGYAHNGTNTFVALVRLNADGSLDTSF